MKLGYFPKCGVCGSHGHVDKNCGVFELNRVQEKRTRSNSSFGLTPEVQREIANIRAAWRIVECQPQH